MLQSTNGLESISIENKIFGLGNIPSIGWPLDLSSSAGVGSCGWQELCVDIVGHPHRDDLVSASLVPLPQPAPPGALYVPTLC